MNQIHNPNNTIVNVALAGLGFGEKVHLPALYSNRAFKPIALYHPNKQKLNTTSLNYNLKGYSDWQDLLNNDQIDSIVIATPPSPRFNLALQALEAGKNLLLEKPVALSAEEIVELQKTSLKQNVSVAVNFEYRFVPLFIEAKRLIDQGLLGEPWLVKFDWLMSSRADKSRSWNWYSDKAQGGGVIGALGTHAFDILHWLIGPTVSISSLLSTSIKNRIEAQSNQKKIVSSEDTCLAQLEILDNSTNSIIGCQLSLSSVAINGRGCWIEIYGSKGKLLLGSDNQKDYVHGFGLWLTLKGERPVAITPSKELTFKKVWEDGRIAPVRQLQSLWANSILNGNPMIPGLSEAFNSQKACDLLKESSLSGIKLKTEFS